jgi:beta-lactamase class D
MNARLIVFLVGTILSLCPPNAHAKELDAFSKCGVTGSTTLYDLAVDRWFKTDKKDAEIQTLPASTFKIFHSLIALDVGATKADEVFKWDGQERMLPVWNKDTIFSDAFKNSTVWVYEALTSRIDKETYKRYLAWANYEGNGDIDNGKDGNFWVYGDWGVSPKEQIKMLVKLHKNELPFSQSSMDVVKDFMRDGNIYGKTGWTQQGGNHIGWWIGYVQRPSSKPLFFATRLVKNVDEDLGNFLLCRKTITDEIIAKYRKI